MNCGAADVLRTLPVDEVWNWYDRLAKAVGAARVGGREPLSSRFLLLYLAPQSRTAPEVFDAPPYLRGHAIVTEALRHHRAVYLTQERMRTGGGGRRWAGIRPRWEDPARHGWRRGDRVAMHYRALVEVPLRWQYTGNEAEKDILHGLGLGFQLRTDVNCRLRPSSGRLEVTFDSFEARIEDRFDFNYDEHLTVPNPDFGSTAARAVCPDESMITVYHRNAQRLERAHRAAPYDLLSQTWQLGPGGPARSGIVSL